MAGIIALSESDFDIKNCINKVDIIAGDDGEIEDAGGIAGNIASNSTIEY